MIGYISACMLCWSELWRLLLLLLLLAALYGTAVLSLLVAVPAYAICGRRYR